MKKKNYNFEKAVEDLQKTGDKASKALNEVSEACIGLKASMYNFDETIGCNTSKLQEKVTKEMIEDAVKQMEKKDLEEWIWVEGYKGTDKDMKCRDYQFMIGVRHDMPEGAKIETCSSGFHLCTRLQDVFGYYDRKDSNRFFKVRALVRKKDVDGTKKPVTATCYVGSQPFTIPWPTWISQYSKLAAKSIEFMRELTLDEIFAGSAAEGWTDEHKKLALEIGIPNTENIVHIDELVELGYSEPLADYIVHELHRYELAVFLTKLPEEPDMNTKMIILFGNADNVKPEVLIKPFNISKDNAYAFGKQVVQGFTDGVSASEN